MRKGQKELFPRWEVGEQYCDTASGLIGRLVSHGPRYAAMVVHEWDTVKWHVHTVFVQTEHLRELVEQDITGTVFIGMRSRHNELPLYRNTPQSKREAREHSNQEGSDA